MKGRKWLFVLGWFLGGLVRGWLDQRALDRAVERGPTCWVPLRVDGITWTTALSENGRTFRLPADAGAWTEEAGAPVGWAQGIAERVADDLNQAERRR